MPDRGKKSLEHLKQKYGLTPEALDAMEYHADMACQICGKFPHEAGTKNRNGEVSPLHVDHDHATSKVRGLLCGKCNMGLCCFRDKPELLLSAFLYLLRHEAGERSYLGPQEVEERREQ